VREGVRAARCGNSTLCAPQTSASRRDFVARRGRTDGDAWQVAPRLRCTAAGTPSTPEPASGAIGPCARSQKKRPLALATEESYAANETPCNARVCVTSAIHGNPRSQSAPLARALARSRCHPYSNKEMAMHERALIANTSPCPTAAEEKPSIAGPMARAKFAGDAFSATADCRSSWTISVDDRRKGRHRERRSDGDREGQPKSDQGVVSSRPTSNIATARRLTKRK